MKKFMRTTCLMLAVLLIAVCFAPAASALQVLTCQANGVHVREAADPNSNSYGLLWKGDDFHTDNALTVYNGFYKGTPGPTTEIAQYYAPRQITGYVTTRAFQNY